MLRNLLLLVVAVFVVAYLVAFAAGKGLFSETQHAGEPLSAGWGYDDPGYGLTWWTTTRGDDAYFGHSGSVPGYTAFVMGNRGRGHGVVFLTNGNAAHPHLIRLSNLAIDLMAEELTR